MHWWRGEDRIRSHWWFGPRLMGETPGDNSCVVHKKSWKPLPLLVPILNIMGMAWLKMNYYDCCRIISKMASWQCFKDRNYNHHNWHGTFLGFAFSMLECHGPRVWLGEVRRCPPTSLAPTKWKLKPPRRRCETRRNCLGCLFKYLQKDGPTERYTNYKV